MSIEDFPPESVKNPNSSHQLELSTDEGGCPKKQHEKTMTVEVDAGGAGAFVFF